MVAWSPSADSVGVILRAASHPLLPTSTMRPVNPIDPAIRAEIKLWGWVPRQNPVWGHTSSSHSLTT